MVQHDACAHIECNTQIMSFEHLAPWALSIPCDEIIKLFFYSYNSNSDSHTIVQQRKQSKDDLQIKCLSVKHLIRN